MSIYKCPLIYTRTRVDICQILYIFIHNSIYIISNIKNQMTFLYIFLYIFACNNKIFEFEILWPLNISKNKVKYYQNVNSQCQNKARICLGRICFDYIKASFPAPLYSECRNIFSVFFCAEHTITLRLLHLDAFLESLLNSNEVKFHLPLNCWN